MRDIANLPKSQRNLDGGLRQADALRANYLGLVLDRHNDLRRSALGDYERNDAMGVPTYDEARQELRGLSNKAEQTGLTRNEEARASWLCDLVEQFRSVEERSSSGATSRPAITRGHAGWMASDEEFRVDVRSAPRGELRSAALRTLEARSKDYELSPRQLDHVDKLIRSDDADTDGSYIARRTILTESAAYRSAFQKVSTMSNPPLLPEEVRALNEFRAMNEGTGADGGYGIPVLIDPTIILSSGALDAPMLSICRIVTITTNEFHGVTAPGVTWAYDAEAAVVSDGTPTFAQPTIPVYKATGWLPFSIEVQQDYPGFASEMSRVLNQGYIDLVAVNTMTGNGTTAPTGIFTAMQNQTTNPAHVTATTLGTLGAVDVRAVWDHIPERFRPRTTWIMNVQVEALVRSFGNGLALSDFTVNLNAEGMSVLMGKPVVLTDYAPGYTGTTGAANYLVAGDFSNYYFIQRAGMSIELVNHLFDQSTARPTGQRGWFAYSRHGAAPVNENAFRILSNT